MITRFILSKQSFNCNNMYDHSTLVNQLTCTLQMRYTIYKAVLVSGMSSKYKKSREDYAHILPPVPPHNI
jgi:hypothetical protein